MTIGMEILNTSGNILIDQNYKTLQLIEKVNSSSVTSVTSGTTVYQRRRWTFTFSHQNAVYAISQSAGTTMPLLATAEYLGGAHTDGLTEVTVSTHGALDGNFDLYVFAPANQISGSENVGLEIYTANGQLGFGSRYKPLRVLAQFDWRADTAGEDTGGYFTADDYALTYSGKRVACIFSRHATAYDGDGSFINRTVPVYTAHFTNNQSTGDCRMSWMITRNGGKEIPYWERPGRYMFIDVTNY